MIDYEEIKPDDIVTVYTAQGPHFVFCECMTFKELESFDDIDKVFKITTGPKHESIELSQLEGKVKGFDIDKILDNYQTCQLELLRLCDQMSIEAESFYDSIFKEDEREFNDDWHYNTMPTLRGYCDMLEIMSGGETMY